MIFAPIYIFTILIFITSCSSTPVKPEPGMALILNTQTFSPPTGNSYTVGKIIEVVSSADGEKYIYPSMPDRLQVKPGKYVIRYMCYDGLTARDVMKNSSSNSTVGELALSAGDILYIRATAAGGIYTASPECTPNVTRESQKTKQKNSNYF